MQRRDFLRTATASMGAALIPFRARAQEAEPVDVELVLAVDASRSIDPEEQELQLGGYTAAFRSPGVIEAITGGAVGAIACTLFVWSSMQQQIVLVPWTKIDSAATAHDFADRLEASRRYTLSGTSISGGIDYAMGLFDQSGVEGTRRVIDVSGDGVNDSGRDLANVRNDAVSKGIIINGLAVADPSPNYVFVDGAMRKVDLGDYYRDEVIGGPGSFVVVAEGFESFSVAIRGKLIREVAGLSETPRFG